MIYFRCLLPQKELLHQWHLIRPSWSSIKSGCASGSAPSSLQALFSTCSKWAFCFRHYNLCKLCRYNLYIVLTISSLSLLSSTVTSFLFHLDFGTSDFFEDGIAIDFTLFSMYKVLKSFSSSSMKDLSAFCNLMASSCYSLHNIFIARSSTT